MRTYVLFTFQPCVLTFPTDIIFRESSTSVYISTSHIQTRLLSTLDTLDALQVSHNRELAAETHAKERLSEKLDRYIGFVQAAEVEKDDLRDAVVQLVEKGGFNLTFGQGKGERSIRLWILATCSRNVNDYSLWRIAIYEAHALLVRFLPDSRITTVVSPSLSTPEPFTGHPTNNTSEHGSDDEIRSYATAMISSLRAERDLERKAHEQTRQQADYRIIQLEAQLARRDAELAACIAHADDLLSQGKIKKINFTV